MLYVGLWNSAEFRITKVRISGTLLYVKVVMELVQSEIEHLFSPVVHKSSSFVWPSPCCGVAGWRDTRAARGRCWRVALTPRWTGRWCCAPLAARSPRHCVAAAPSPWTSATSPAPTDPSPSPRGKSPAVTGMFVFPIKKVFEYFYRRFNATYYIIGFVSIIPLFWDNEKSFFALECGRDKDETSILKSNLTKLRTQVRCKKGL